MNGEWEVSPRCAAVRGGGPAADLAAWRSGARGGRGGQSVHPRLCARCRPLPPTSPFLTNSTPSHAPSLSPPTHPQFGPPTHPPTCFSEVAEHIMRLREHIAKEMAEDLARVSADNTEVLKRWARRCGVGVGGAWGWEVAANLRL